jgi:opacity protein-like surface antigen
MKKSLLALLLAVTLVSSVFATDKGAMEADIKAGYIAYNNVDFGPYSATTDGKFILGADFYYYVHPNVALGFGINNIFDSSEADYDGEKYNDKFGFTNIYFTVKPKIDLKSDIFTSVYGIVQLGYGFFRLDYDGAPFKPGTKNGLYWGIGAGAEIMKNFIFELIYSCNNGTIDFSGHCRDIKYSIFSINIGYKFNI